MHCRKLGRGNMGIGQKIVDTAQDLEMKERVKFVQWVSDEEHIEFDDAWLICTGQDPARVMPEYSLGFKLASPLVQTGLYLQPGKKNRQKYRDNFKSELTPAELQLFENEVNGAAVRSQLKKKLKRAKKSTDADDSGGSSEQDPEKKNGD